MIELVSLSESDDLIRKRKVEGLREVHEMLQRPKSYEEARRQVLTNRGEL